MIVPNWPGSPIVPVERKAGRASDSGGPRARRVTSAQERTRAAAMTRGMNLWPDSIGRLPANRVGIPCRTPSPFIAVDPSRDPLDRFHGPSRGASDFLEPLANQSKLGLEGLHLCLEAGDLLGELGFGDRCGRARDVMVFLGNGLGCSLGSFG